ncbi:MAG: PmoA family protein [Bacteroidota bacterium]|nr:PmoA family protein [Bacteroidota bacterium]
MELKNFQQKVANLEFKLQKGIGLLNTTVEWKSPLWKNDSEAYLKEDTKITIYPKSGNCRCIDFEIHLKALTDRLSIGGSDDEKGYSGFSVRLKLPADVTFSGANGLIEPVNTAIEAGNSMNINGAFLNGGERGGVVIWSDPSNPAPSNSWILRKAASMQYVCCKLRKKAYYSSSNADCKADR